MTTAGAPVWSDDNKEREETTRSWRNEGPEWLSRTGVRFVVIGAGVHGLSTAYHLALELKAHGQRQRRRHPRRRQDRHCRRRLRDRLRRHPQQLLPAGDARAHGRTASRSGRATPRPTATTRSATCRSAPRCMHEDVGTIDRAAAGDRLRRRSSSKAKPTAVRYMQGIFDDWQAQGITSVLHEKKGGYANNTGVDARPRRQGRGRGRAHPDRRRGHRLPARPATRRSHRRS